ncbi:MAG: sigma 54-interacting transcriptional regulator [Candidatus Hydrogenedentes bacterium]|nr:sigma 54-interacting transcriptional regulator [Candidatus Hydrogenedentota bacterium]
MARVLVVEDEAVLRLTFQEFLSEQGHEVFTAQDYDEAVDLIEHEDFDLVVTDIILGGRTGVDLLRTIRDMGIECPVVMVTGEPTIESAAEAVRLGAFDYLAKPVTRDALLRVARLSINHKKLRDERNLYAARMDMYRRDLEAIFNSVNEGIITVDAEMRVRQANPAAAEILALPPAQLAKRPFAEVMPGKLDPARKALEQTLETHAPVDDCRVAFPGDNGVENIVIVNTMPLVGEGGAFEGAVMMIRDVTRLTRLEKQIAETQQYRDIIGKSRKMQEIFVLVRELAETDSTALIYGESGTGKELVAAALHHESHRAKGPFVKVNCAALSENILESELFGHVKGAFTGAVKDRAGRFEAADGGTILLDEIGDVSPRLQLRLLRVLQEREFERVGDSLPIRTNVRVIASTNQDLDRKIQLGEFRQDLYYRLNVVRIEIPPLRARREDIPLLVEHFCRRFNRALKREITGCAPETMEVFMRYAWPGNVRELENCLERAFIVCHDSLILPRHLPHELQGLGLGRSLGIENLAGGDGARTSDRDRIISVLNQTDWNVAKAARILRMARNTLYQKMNSMQIRRPVE